jgi:hypothetical protein
MLAKPFFFFLVQCSTLLKHLEKLHLMSLLTLFHVSGVFLNVNIRGSDIRTIVVEKLTNEAKHCLFRELFLFVVPSGVSVREHDMRSVLPISWLSVMSATIADLSSIAFEFLPCGSPLAAVCLAFLSVNASRRRGFGRAWIDLHDLVYLVYNGVPPPAPREC